MAIFYLMLIATAGVLAVGALPVIAVVLIAPLLLFALIPLWDGIDAVHRLTVKNR